MRGDAVGSSVEIEWVAELDRGIASLERGEATTVTLAEAEGRVMRRLAKVKRRRPGS